MGIAPSIYFVYREQNTTLVDIGAYDDDELDVTGAGAPEHVRVLDVTDGTLPLLGVSPVWGAYLLDKMIHLELHKPSYSRIHTGNERFGGAVIRHRQLDYGGRRAQGNHWGSSPNLPFPRSERPIVDTSDAMGSCHDDPWKF